MTPHIGDRPVGSHAAYRRGCRCAPCVEEGRRARRAMDKRLRLHGPAYVDGAPAREHVLHLRASGMSNQQIAAAATMVAVTRGWPVVNRTQVRHLLGETGHGQARLRPTTAAAFLAVPPAPTRPLPVRPHRDRSGRCAGILVDPAPTVRRLRALAAIGWTLRDVARHAGCSAETLRPFRRGTSGSRRASSGLAAAVARAYSELENTPGPSPRTRQVAAAQGWHPPGWWDDIDQGLGGEDGLGGHLERPSAVAERRATTTARRAEVDRLTRLGFTADQIAERLHTTARTVVRDRAALGIRGTPGITAALRVTA